MGKGGWGQHDETEMEEVEGGSGTEDDETIFLSVSFRQNTKHRIICQREIPSKCSNICCDEVHSLY